MRIAHLSDPHLGHSRYNRVDASGVNQRMADVHATFGRAVDMIVAARPDVVLVAGDIFDRASAGPAAEFFACEQFRKLAAVAPVICVAGNHDETNNAAKGASINLLRQHGVRLAKDRAERFNVAGVAVLAVPECVATTTVFEPDPNHATNILLVHAAIKGTQQGYGTIEVDALNADRWEYVACGDYHQFHSLASNAFYSGSLEFVSTDPWRESRAGVPKGFIVFDTETGAHEFHEVPGLRPHIDLAPIYADRMTPEHVQAAIVAAVESIEGGIDDRVVRLVVHGIERSVQYSLDHRVIRRYKGRALHFQLDMRRPEEFTVGVAVGRPGAADAFEREQEEQFQQWKREQFPEDYAEPAGEPAGTPDDALPELHESGDPYHLGEMSDPAPGEPWGEFVARQRAVFAARRGKNVVKGVAA
jgi:exonuclease SbcD